MSTSDSDAVLKAYEDFSVLWYWALLPANVRARAIQVRLADPDADRFGWWEDFAVNCDFAARKLGYASLRACLLSVGVPATDELGNLI